MSLVISMTLSTKMLLTFLLLWSQSKSSRVLMMSMVVEGTSTMLRGEHASSKADIRVSFCIMMHSMQYCTATKIIMHSMRKMHFACHISCNANVTQKHYKLGDLMIHLNCQIQEYMIPNPQYMEINIRGTKGSLSPKIKGCKNWLHISTTKRPTR